MRRRVHPASPRIEVVPVSKPGRLVTLEDPGAPPTLAQDAFARLRPPAGSQAESVASWRERVAKVAIAVRVMAAPEDALVPAASHRPEAAVGSIRTEAVAIAKETKNIRVEELVVSILDKFGVR